MGRRSIWAATDIGLVRKTNEDSFGLPTLISSGREQEVYQGQLPTEGGWAVIADGMGGHEAGEMASRAVVETFHRQATKTLTEIGIMATLDEANMEIYARVASGTGSPGMGSTIVGVTFNGQHCFVFNIGDSRLYVRRGDDLLQLSIDDTLRAGGARRSHALTQSLGGTRKPAPLVPHVREWKTEPDDLLMLCSDGLSDMLSGEGILRLLNGEHPQPALTLVNAAVAAGGHDNVTAIVIGPERG